MSVSEKCGCGHGKGGHWEYARQKGCSFVDGRRRQCSCRGYSPISPTLVQNLAELLQCVADCERDWSLMNRIDSSLGLLQRSRRAAG